MLIQETHLVKDELILKLHKLGIKTVQDALFYFPRTYEDRRNFKHVNEIVCEEPSVIYGDVLNTSWRTTRNKKRFFEVMINDNGDRLALQWYFASNRLAGFLKSQKHIMAFGVPKFRQYMPIMTNPDWSPFATPECPGLSFNRIVPIYSLTEGIRQDQVRKLIYRILQNYLREHTQSYVPEEIAQRYHLPDFYDSIKEVHIPRCADINRLLARDTPSHKRLIFEELFVKSLCIEIGRKKMEGDKILVNPDNIAYLNTVEKFYLNAGYKPTQTQVHVIQECENDILNGRPIRKILHGDVGTGKTTVAFDVAMFLKHCGFQTAFMVPTEILAKQHYFTAQKLFNDTGIQCDLLIGGMNNKDRLQSLKFLEGGMTDIVIGTHALIQDDIKFKNLGLVIIDEQHKFGAIQRTILSEKGYNVHLLQMSATPIPRSIMMTLYGDMSVSTLQRIPGKSPAVTKLFQNSQRRQLYSFMKSHLATGDQIYVVYPLVEDSDKLDLNSATTMAQKLSEHFKDYKVGLVHGRMKPKEKDEVMEQFRNGDIHILVSTTVIEVGVDIHNATIMIIEHAERFGLSQLHQLRGRVGRGKKTSYCVLVTHGRLGDDAKRRIHAMLRTTDGFEIAEEDLSIRGPGDYFGVDQSGFISSFHMADLIRDVKALEYARADARKMIESDPELTDFPLLKNKVASMLKTIYV